MRPHRPRSFALALGLVALVTALPATAARPVVVELFTSQGCSSCPPADALLGRLADDPGVIALSMHVDYWNRLGWRDPFARARFSERQRRYAERIDDGNRYTSGVYTPQMVVDGRHAVIGHAERSVRAAIERARSSPPALRPRLVGSPASAVELPAHDAAQGATVWLLAYDDRHVTRVEAGENAGRALTNHHVVRTMQSLGRWNGEATRLPFDGRAPALAERDGLVVLVQQGRAGPILGAAAHPLDEG